MSEDGEVLCSSCEHPLALHEVVGGQVFCNQQIHEGAGYTVDCWWCELTPEVLLAR